MPNTFTYGLHASSEYGLIIEERPTIVGAALKYTSVSIPGRHGNIHYSQNAFQELSETYKVAFRDAATFYENCHDVKAWLLQTGLSKLSNSYDATHYRMALCVGPVDIINEVENYGRATVKFLCDPRNFLTSGDTATTITTASGTISNPTTYNSKPVVEITTTGGGTATINGVTITLDDSLTGTVTIDSENQDCYKGATNINNLVELTEFPELDPGTNNISRSGNITSIKITPKWWEA